MRSCNKIRVRKKKLKVNLVTSGKYVKYIAIQVYFDISQ